MKCPIVRVAIAELAIRVRRRMMAPDRTRRRGRHCGALSARDTGSETGWIDARAVAGNFHQSIACSTAARSSAGWAAIAARTRAKAARKS